MTIQELKQGVFRLAEENKAVYEEISTELYEHPELSGQEMESSAYLVRKMQERGFRVQYPYGGIATAFRCEIGEGHPKVAFLAEYDALPGYGPGKDQPAHACGHNWIAASTFGAADVLAKVSEHFSGTIVYLGTPAEETIGGKIDLVHAGCFEDIDAVFQMHLQGGAMSELNSSSLALDSVEFSFEGKAAHGAANPWDGINALDAVNLTFAGINALRQHVTPDVRMHGIVSEGGLAPNIVPAHAAAKFYIRAASRDYLNDLTQKVIRIAKGAELMTGAIMSYRFFENPFDDLRCDETLTACVAEGMHLVGAEPYNTAFSGSTGSTDIGNVSQVCPTNYVAMGLGNTDGSDIHQADFLAQVNGPLAYDKLQKAIKAMAAAALDVFADENVQKKVLARREELRKKAAQR